MYAQIASQSTLSFRFSDYETELYDKKVVKIVRINGVYLVPAGARFENLHPDQKSVRLFFIFRKGKMKIKMVKIGGCWYLPMEDDPTLSSLVEDTKYLDAQELKNELGRLLESFEDVEFVVETFSFYCLNEALDCIWKREKRTSREV